MTPLFKPVTAALHQISPKHTTYALAAGVAAPFVLSDKDRGVIDTALVTSPLIAAAFVAAPRLSQTAKTVKQRTKLFKTNVAAETNPEDVLRRLYQSKRQAPKPVNVSALQTSIEKYLASLTDQNAVLAAHAMRTAQKRSYTLQEMWQSTLWASRATPDITVADVRRIYEENKTNPRFLREMHRQLPKLRRFQKTGVMLSNEPIAKIMETRLDVPDVFNLSSATQRSNFLNTMRAAGKENVAKAILKHQGIFDDEITLISERLAQGGNRPIAVELTKGQGRGNFRLYLRDDTTGTARVGKNYSRVAVARHVHFGSVNKMTILPVDLYIAENLHEDWKTLHKEQMRFLLHHGGDPDNPYDIRMRKDRMRMGVTPEAAWLRSHSIAPSHLRRFTDYTGNAVTWEELKNDWRGWYFRSAAERGLITAVGSEGAVAQKGVVQLPVLSLLDPLGLPRPDKQQATYRALTKSFTLIGDIPEHLQPNVVSSFFADTVLHGRPFPGLKATVGGITPVQRTFTGTAVAAVREHITPEAWRQEIRKWGEGLFPELKGKARYHKLRSEYKKIHGITSYRQWATQRAAQILGTPEMQKKLASILEKNILPEAAERVAHAGGPEKIAAYLTGLMTKDLGAFRAAEALAAAGEGDTIMNADVFGRFKFMGVREVDVQSLNKELLENHLIYDAEGKLKSNWESLLLGRDKLIGVYEDQFITGKGTTTPRIAVLGMRTTEEGATRVSLGYVMSVAERGTKINLGDQKGLVWSMAGDDFNATIRLANEISYQIGQGKTLSFDVNALSAQAYYSRKRGSTDAILSDLSETLRIMEAEAPGHEAVSTLKQQLAKESIVVDERGFLRSQSDAILASGNQYAQGRRERASRIIQFAEEFYQKVEGHVANTYGARIAAQDPIYKVPSLRRSVVPHSSLDAFINYLQSHPEERARLGQHRSDVWANFLQFHHATDVVMPWDHSSLNVAREAVITYDEMRLMAMAGHHSSIAEILGRAKYPQGDPFQFARFVEYLQRGNFSVPFGDYIEENTPRQAFRGLRTPHGRAGTLFDHTDPRFANPFSVKLDEPLVTKSGQTISYVAHPGWAAHGMVPNAYEGGTKYSLKDVERRFNEIWVSRGEQQLAAIERYHETFADFITGKESYRRARIVDPRGIAGYIRTTYVKDENPFVAYISEDLLSSFTAEDAKRLRRGESVYGHLMRTPASVVHAVEVKLGKDLGEAQIAYGEGLRIGYRSDDDLDRFVFHPLRDQETVEQVKRSMAPGGAQRELYEYMYAMRNEEDSALWTAEYLRQRQMKSSPLSNLAKQIDYDRSTGQLRPVAERALGLWQSRQAGATTGAYSNFLDTLMTALYDHPALKNDPKFVSRAIPVLWGATRQIPITAAKDAEGKLTAPMEILERIKTAWANAPQSEEAAEHFVAELSRLSAASGETSILDQNIIDRYGLTRGYVDKKAVDLVDASGKLLPQLRGKDIEVARSLLDFSPEFREQMKQLATDRTFRAEAAARALMYSPPEFYEGTRLKRALELDREAAGVFPMLADSSAYAKSSARQSARMLGAANDTLKDAAKGVKAALKPAAPILTAGLGIAAAAGFMFGGVGQRSGRAATPPSPSSGRWRPEVAVGESDHVPGEPVAGSQAPSNPKRTLAPERPSVRTAVVGQMHPSHNMEVTMRGSDRSAYREMERQLTNMVSAGQTHITKNYVGGWRQNSLRDRERLRDELQKQQRYS